MRGLVLSLGLAAGAALFVPLTAEAAVGAGGAAQAAAPQAEIQATPVYWVWHGRHWHHRRFIPRVYRGGRWIPGYYTYY